MVVGGGGRFVFTDKECGLKAVVWMEYSDCYELLLLIHMYPPFASLK